MPNNKCILELLENDHVIGCGDFVSTLEKRMLINNNGSVAPESIKKIQYDLIESGSKVIQTPNKETCLIAREVGYDRDILVAGRISGTQHSSMKTRQMEEVKSDFRKQCEIFKNKVDFMVVDHFENVQECEWAIDVVKEIIDCPVLASLLVSKHGDLKGISCEDCAVRMVQSGADIIGINCNFGPMYNLDILSMMKKGLEEAGVLENVYLSCHLLSHGTIYDVQDFTRQACDMGVRYIGCYGFEPRLVRILHDKLNNGWK